MPFGLRMSDGLSGQQPYWLNGWEHPSDAVTNAEELRVVFREQPRPLQARQRIAYRTAVLLVTLDSFRNKSSAVANLHIVLWALRSPKTRTLFKNWWAGTRLLDFVSQRIEPTLDISVRLALADGLIELTGAQKHRLKLTTKGQAMADAVNATDNLLVAEKQLLKLVAPLSDAGFEKRVGA